MSLLKTTIKFFCLFLLSYSCYASNFHELIRAASIKHSVDINLIHGVIKAESAYNQRAVSPVGAAGLMQLMPETARRFGVNDRFDAEQNIDGGCAYLHFLLNLFDGNVKLAVAAYNAGEGAVIKYKGIPPYHETQEYVKKVIAFAGIQQSFSNNAVLSGNIIKDTSPKITVKKHRNAAAWKALCDFYTPGNCEVN